MKTLGNVKPQALVKFAVFAALLTGIYYSTYSWLIHHDWPREDYNYCYLIPLVVLYPSRASSCSGWGSWLVNSTRSISHPGL